MGLVRSRAICVTALGKERALQAYIAAPQPKTPIHQGCNEFYSFAVLPSGHKEGTSNDGLRAIDAFVEWLRHADVDWVYIVYGLENGSADVIADGCMFCNEEAS